MASSIQVSVELLEELKSRKLFARESYEEIVWDLIEDTRELGVQTKKQLAAAREDVTAGRVVPLSEVKKLL